MNDKAEDKNVTRRDFIRTVGLAGITAALTGVPGAVAASEPSGAVASASTVPRRKLGKTGVEVPILALGGTLNTKNNHLLLRQAMKWGVTYWDNAESYFNGMSEEGMGLFFARTPEARKKIFLATKMHARGANFTDRLDKSLKRLQTDHVDLLCIHGITGIEDMPSNIRAWAEEMKKAGKIKLFGFSTHTNMEDCLLGAARLDWIDAIMFAYNFQNMNTPKMEEAVNACAKAGIGLVAIKSQAGTPGTKKAPGQALLEMIE